MFRQIFVFFMLIFYLVIVVQGNCVQASQITYFATNPDEYGLWGYNPELDTKNWIAFDINPNYQFSSDHKYLAFLANNRDRGKDQTNSISLWVKDILTGRQTVIESEFTIEDNRNKSFVWFDSNDIATIKLNSEGKQRIRVYQADGDLIWDTGDLYEYLTHNGSKVIVRDLNYNFPMIYNVITRSLSPIEIQLESVISASLSPRGNYLCYQTLDQVILVNLHTTEKVYIDIDNYRDMKITWSPNETYLIYQSQKYSTEQGLHNLKIFNVETGIKEWELSSQRKIISSWASDERQMVFSIFQADWNIVVWSPDQYTHQVIQTGLQEQPIPVYKPESHQFAFVNYLDNRPVLVVYDMDKNRLTSLTTGLPGSGWLNLDWAAVEVGSIEFEWGTLNWSGWGEEPEAILITPLPEYVVTCDGADSADQYFKWSPVAGQLVYLEPDTGLYLVDSHGEIKQIYSGDQLSEPFWNPGGELIAFIDGAKDGKIIIYAFDREEYIAFPISTTSGFRLFQWMENKIWFYDGCVAEYSLMNSDWEYLSTWKDYWWPIPMVQHAHYLNESLWKIGDNIWHQSEKNGFRVITRLAEYHVDDWIIWQNGWPEWSPGDDQIVYNRHLTTSEGVNNTDKWEIWLMERVDFSEKYLCIGRYPQWLTYYQLLFLRDGDLYLANLITQQIIGFRTDLEEQTFKISSDGSIIAVLAKDQTGSLGLYYYKFIKR